MKRRVVLFPLLFASGLFLADKLLLIGAVRDRTLHYQKSEPEFYESRRSVFASMVEASRKHDGRSVALILGSSRSGSFSPFDIEAHAPGTTAFNFSVPMGGITHAFYWTEKAVNAGIHPAFLLLETDAATFSEGSLAFMLQYDFDPVFVLANTGPLAPATSVPMDRGFTAEDADTWILKYLFATYRYPVEPRSIIENYRRIPGGSGLRFVDVRFQLRPTFEQSMRDFHGAFPNPGKAEADTAFLEKDALFMENRVFAGRSYSKTQYYFFQRLLDLAAREGIPVIAHRPVLADPFARAMARQAPGFDERIRRSLEETARASMAAGRPVSFRYVDPEEKERLKCRAFIDSLHLGGRCFPELTERIFRHGAGR